MESTDGEYTLRFYCRRQVPRDIVDKLIAIKDSIGSVAIDLNGAFAVYSGNRNTVKLSISLKIQTNII